jgi:hypothetical protein
MLKGEVKITGTSSAPTATAGMLHYDTDDNILYIYNGSAWVALYS